MKLIPPDWLPAGAMARVICHWTAGGYTATPAERAHYHLLIEGDGRLVRGEFAITDNLSTADGHYAAHTLNGNTGSIGIAVCAMREAVLTPFDPGPCPMLRAQWELMARVVAELCAAYAIPITPRTVLGHGEVPAILGIAQREKWDPLALPWEPSLDQQAVGEAFRARVRHPLEGGGAPGKAR